MNDINVIAISGRLTKDPELKFTQGGAGHLVISLASNYSAKKGDQWEEQANFFDLDLWGPRAEKLATMLSKGSRVFVTGELRYSSWETQEGGKRSRVSINVSDLILGDAKKAPESTQNGSGGKNYGQGSLNRTMSESTRVNDHANDGDFADDIPF